MNTMAPQFVEHQVAGDKLLARVRQILHQGNVRRIIVKNPDGLTLLEVPLTVGVVGAVLQPVWVALGAIAALAAHYRIVVEQTEPETEAEAREREAYAFASRPDV